MKVKAYLGIGYANSCQERIIEIPDEELEGLSEDEQGKIISEYVDEWANEYIDIGYEVVE